MLDITTTNDYQSRLVFQRALVDIAQAAANYPNGKFYQQLLDSTLSAIHGAEGGSVLVRAGDDHFYYRAARGYQLEQLHKVRFSVQDMAKVHGSLQPRLRRCANTATQFDATQAELLRQHGRLDDIQITLAVPVILQNRLVMVISLDNFEHADAFDSEAVSRAETIAAHVTGLLERSELNKLLAAQQVVQEKFRAILIRALTETDEIAFLHNVLVQTISLIPGAQAGSVFLRVHADSYHIVAAVGHKLDAAQKYAFRSAELSLSIDMETFKPSVLRNIFSLNGAALSSESLAVLQQTSREQSISSTLVIPVTLDNELAAIVYIDNFNNEDIFDDSLELAELVGEQLSVFLQRFKYEQKLHLQTRYQKALLEILKQALTATDDASFYDYVLAQAVDTIPSVEAGSIIHQLPNGHYRYVAAKGYPLNILQKINLSSHEALLDRDLSGSSYVLTQESFRNRNQRYNSEQRELFAQVSPEQPILTTLMLPIRIANDLPAVMYLDNFHDEKAFDDEIIAMAEGFASQVTVVLNRLRWQHKQTQYVYTKQLLTEIEALLLRVDDIRTFFPELTHQLLRETRLNIVFVELFFQDTERSTPHKDQVNHVCYNVFSLDDNLTKRQYAALASASQLPLDEQTRSGYANTRQHTHLVYIDDIRTTDYPWGDDPTWYIAEDILVGSAMLITLYQQGRLWGRYNLFFREPYALNSITEDFFHKVSSNITVALDKQASREALERELLRMQAIVSASEALQSSFSEQDVFSQTVTSAQRYIRAKTVFLIYEADGLMPASYSNSDIALTTLSISNLSPKHIVAVAGQHNEAVYKQGLELATSVLEQDQACRAPAANLTLLALPLTGTQRKTTGVLVVAATSLSKGDGIFLEALAQACSSALTRLKLVTAREQEAAAYRALANFGATIEAINDVDTLMRLGMKRLMVQLGLEAAHTYDVHYEDFKIHHGANSYNASSVAETHGDVYSHSYLDPNTYALTVSDSLSRQPQSGDNNGFHLPSSTGLDIQLHAAGLDKTLGQHIATQQSVQSTLAVQQERNVQNHGDLSDALSLDVTAPRVQLSPGELWGRQPEGFLAMFNYIFTPRDGVICEVLEQKRLRYVETYQHYPNASPIYIDLGLRTLLVIPVMQRKRVVKIICLSSYQRVQPLSEDKLTIAQSFVRRLENAIERVDDVREVEATREATLRALGLALEYRDLETKGHSERVVNLSLAVGSKLGFSAAGMQALRWGAYLHDIGKVGVPDSILLKPGSLNPAEFEAIKKHTILGATLCSDIPFLPADSIAIVRSHHERWDGSGYPDALSSTDIPLMARLFSLVDVYDALSNVRIYKDAWQHDQVVQELSRLKGKQFDPELTDVFLEVVNEQAN